MTTRTMRSSGAPRFTPSPYQGRSAMRPSASPSPPDRARLAGVLECVVNISEGRDLERIAADRRGSRHRPARRPHRSAPPPQRAHPASGEDAPRAVATATVAAIDLRDHDGVHPRIGVVDVVPFVPLDGAHDRPTPSAARDRFAQWVAGGPWRCPASVYGPERTLPEVRRHAFAALAPDHGPDRPHPTAGALCRRRPRPSSWPTTCGWPTPTSTSARRRRRRRCAAPASGPSASPSATGCRCR